MACATENVPCADCLGVGAQPAARLEQLYKGVQEPRMTSVCLSVAGGPRARTLRRGAAPVL